MSGPDASDMLVERPDDAGVTKSVTDSVTNSVTNSLNMTIQTCLKTWSIAVKSQSGEGISVLSVNE